MSLHHISRPERAKHSMKASPFVAVAVAVFSAGLMTSNAALDEGKAESKMLPEKFVFPPAFLEAVLRNVSTTMPMTHAHEDGITCPTGCRTEQDPSCLDERQRNRCHDCIICLERALFDKYDATLHYLQLQAFCSLPPKQVCSPPCRTYSPTLGTCEAAKAKDDECQASPDPTSEACRQAVSSWMPVGTPGSHRELKFPREPAHCYTEPEPICKPNLPEAEKDQFCPTQCQKTLCTLKNLPGNENLSFSQLQELPTAQKLGCFPPCPLGEAFAEVFERKQCYTEAGPDDNVLIKDRTRCQNWMVAQRDFVVSGELDRIENACARSALEAMSSRPEGFYMHERDWVSLQKCASSTDLGHTTNINWWKKTGCVKPCAEAYCSRTGTDCQHSRCCIDNLGRDKPGAYENARCFEKDGYWSECRWRRDDQGSQCTPGSIYTLDPYDSLPWTCKVLEPTPPPPDGNVTTIAV